VNDAPEPQTGDGASETQTAAGEKSRRIEIPPVADWARAFAGGLKDTWSDIVSEGRKGARRSHDANWAKFEAKRKKR